jgi:multidrug resistance efflux pump
MTRNSVWFPLMVVLVLWSASPAFSQEQESSSDGKASADGKDDSKSDAEKKDDKEEKKPEKKELKLSGVFVSDEVTEIILRPESWSSWKVKEAVAHGTRVAADDVLIEFDREDIERKIEDSRRSQYAASLTLKLAQEEVEFTDETYPMERKILERNREHAKEDLKYYLEVELPNAKEAAERSLRNTKYRLEYAQEELDQLEKMYKADDLTEETEEIILLRARRDVEEMKQFVERSEERTEHTLNVTLPRQKVQTEEQTEKTLLETEKKLATQEIEKRRKQHDLEQQQIAHERAAENLEELVKDLNLMTVKSPAAGIVYYGQDTRGKWSQVATLEKQLRQGGSVNTNQVIMSIVNPEPLTLVVDVPEDKLKDLTVGTAGHVTPKAFPDLKIPAKVASISFVPISPGTFDGKVTLMFEERPERLMPGMTAEFIVELKNDEGEKE